MLLFQFPDFYFCSNGIQEETFRGPFGGKEDKWKHGAEGEYHQDKVVGYDVQRMLQSIMGLVVSHLSLGTQENLDEIHFH